jgi:hypothetical protein
MYSTMESFFSNRVPLFFDPGGSILRDFALYCATGSFSFLVERAFPGFGYPVYMEHSSLGLLII